MTLEERFNLQGKVVAVIGGAGPHRGPARPEPGLHLGLPVEARGASGVQRIQKMWQHLTGIPSRVRGLLVPRRRVWSRGLTFTLQCDNRITEWRWRHFTVKEPETLGWIDRCLHDGQTLFDVGANIGVYSIYAALRHPGCRVVAFEPEYANLHLLRDNILKNRLQHRIEVYSLALGKRTGISRLHIQDATPGSALHTESTEPLALTRTRKPVIWQEGVSAYTLDAFCREVGVRPHCVKIDVDGTEPEVLEGAAGTLRSETLRSVILEMGGEPAIREACTRLLVAAGLRCEWSGPTHANEIWVRDERRSMPS